MPIKPIRAHDKDIAILTIYHNHFNHEDVSHVRDIVTKMPKDWQHKYLLGIYDYGYDVIQEAENNALYVCFNRASLPERYEMLVRNVVQQYLKQGSGRLENRRRASIHALTYSAEECRQLADLFLKECFNTHTDESQSIKYEMKTRKLFNFAMKEHTNHVFRRLKHVVEKDRIANHAYLFTCN